MSDQGKGPLTLALALLAVGGCGVSETDEPAFPNQRPSYPLDGRLRAYVTNRLSDTISVVDLDRMVALGSAPVGRDPIDVDGPTGLAIDRGRGLVYVALSHPPAGGGHHASDTLGPPPGTLRVLALDDLRPLADLRVDRTPVDLSLTRDGRAILVSHADPPVAIAPSAPIEDRRATLVLVEPAPAMITGDARVKRVAVCVAPAAAVYDEARARAFVACAGEDALVVVDTGAPAVLARVPAGDGNGVAKPGALVADPTGAHLLLSNRVLRQVVLFSADDAPLRRFTSAPMWGVPQFAAWLSDEEILVPTQSPSGAVVVDAASGAVRREIDYGDDACASPRQAWRARDGRVFLLCEGDGIAPGAVARIDPATLAVEARVAVGIAPDRLAVVEP